MINELQVISTAKTKRARQLVLNYLLSQGIPFGDIKYYDNEDGWTICLRKYESIDSYSFKLSDSYPSVIDVTKDRILVSEIKVMSKKPDKIKPLLWGNDYRSNDIGSMLSDYSKSSSYPKPKLRRG